MRTPPITFGNASSPLALREVKIDTLMPLALTYERLLAHGCDTLARQGKGKQQIKNFASALRLWIRTHGFATSKAIHADFAEDFDRHFLQFSDDIAGTLAQRTQCDRQEQILWWRRTAEAVRRHDVLPDSFGEALQFCITSSAMSVAEVAREVGLSPTAIRHWISKGGMPSGSTVENVLRLEALLKLPKGTLIGRVPLARRAWYARGLGSINTSTSFTKTRRQQTAATEHYTPKFQGRIASQWEFLLRFKTDSLRIPRQTGHPFHGKLDT